jgi:hypothetical protein
MFSANQAGAGRLVGLDSSGMQAARRGGCRWPDTPAGGGPARFGALDIAHLAAHVSGAALPSELVEAEELRDPAARAYRLAELEAALAPILTELTASTKEEVQALRRRHLSRTRRAIRAALSNTNGGDA